MVGRAVLVGLVLGGCGFQLPSGSAIGDGAPLADGAAALDRSNAAPIIYVGSETMFGVADVATRTATVRGTFTDAATGQALTMYELAMGANGELLGITSQPAKLYTIDPATGAGTLRATLDHDDAYWGATTAPAGDLESAPVVFAGTPSGVLYRIDPATGHVTTVGPFGGSFTVSGDLVWVHGHGLYGTMNSSACDDCLVTISPTTGQATLLRALDAGDFYAAGSRDGELYVMRGAGECYELDPVTGVTIAQWSMPGAWSVAAP
jgi:hypothetical protein